MHAHIENGIVKEYPITNIRARFPNASLPVNLTKDDALPEGYVFVHQLGEPTYNQSNQKLKRNDNPELIDGRWVIGFTAVSMTEEELAASVEIYSRHARAKRNRLLSESDWTQTLDAPLDRSVWAAYRQALRDLPINPDWPHITWPEKPAAP